MDVQLSIHKIYSEDALELDGIIFEPTEPTKTIVIHIHGKEGHFLQNHFVTELGQAYAKSGIAFLTFNNRGHDYVADVLRKTHGGFEFVTRGSAFDILSEAPLDINAVIEYAKKLGYSTIFLQGHSLGPHKITYYMSHSPKHSIAGCIFLSTSDIKYLFNAYVPNWKHNRAVAEILVKEGRESEFMPIKLWSNALVTAKTYLDWTREDADSWIFNFSDEVPHCKYFPTITVPLLVVNPENDVAVNTPQADIEKILKTQTMSLDFEFHIVPKAPHNFSQHEEELSHLIVPWVLKHRQE